MFKKRKSISLAITLIFLFTVIMPGAVFAADNDYTKFSSTYKYITADEEQTAGTATVKSKAYGGDIDAIQIKLILPEGVEFTDKPDAGDVGTGTDTFVQVTSGDTFNYIKSDSTSIVIKNLNVVSAWQAENDTTVKFDFSAKTIDIDSDFTGNLDVTINVWGLKGESIVWSESDTLTIAKVAGSGSVLVSAKSPKIVSKGSAKKGAEIKIYETQPGKLGKETVRFDILTDGVTFNKMEFAAASFGYPPGTQISTTFTEDDQRFEFTPVSAAKIFPGDATFTPYLDVDPDVTGDIKIRVSSAEGTLTKTTVVVATVGDAKAKIDKIEDNDTVAYSGQITELDVEITIKTEDGQNFKNDDMMTFKLNKGKFANKEDFADDSVTDNGTVKLYDSDKAFYVTFDGNFSKFTLSGFEVKLDNDVEPGDITLTIGGDYGDLDEVTIGVAAKPITLSAEKTPILAEALNQKAGDIIIKEAGDGALKKGGVLVLELPSGIELNGKPKLDVVEGNFDGTLSVIDDKIIAVKVDRESSDASEIKIYNINYDTGRLALTGDVNIKAYFIDKDIVNKTEVKDMYDKYDDTGIIATVANATVVSENEVTATFTVGDEGVTVVNGRTLVQVNKLCEVLGMQKSWDPASKTAYFVLSGKVVAFPMGENAIYINGTRIAVDQGGKIINDYTYATLRGIQMAFGGELDWDNDTKTATFKFKK